MGNHLLGSPTGAGFTPGTLSSGSSATAPTKSTTAAGDQAATPPGPGQVINPAQTMRPSLPNPIIKPPSTVGGFRAGMRRINL